MAVVHYNAPSQSLSDVVLAMHMILLCYLCFDFITNHGAV